MKNKDRIFEVKDFLKIESVDNYSLIDLYKIFIRLELFCLENNLGSLSACQIGIFLPLFVLKRKEKFEYYFNCSYLGLGEKIKSIEECVSISDSKGKYRTFEVERFLELDIRGKKLDIIQSSKNDGLSVSDVKIKEDGKISLIFQHEIDHCFGISLLNIGKEINLF